MTATGPTGTQPEIAWLLDQFAQAVAGTRQVAVVSADGLLMAASRGLDRDDGDRLAAIVSGLSSLSAGVARHEEAGRVRQTVIEMDRMTLVLMTISDGSVLAVLAEASCDLGLVGYEMALLVRRAETELTPLIVGEEGDDPPPTDAARREPPRPIW